MCLFFHDSICAMCFLHQQTLSHMRKRFPEWVQSGRMNIARVNIGFFTEFKKIKQRRISFVLGYLPMILWKISTAIYSIKHRILATFNIKKKFNSDSLYAFKTRGDWFFCVFLLVELITNSIQNFIVIKQYSLWQSYNKHVTKSTYNRHFQVNMLGVHCPQF